MIDSFACPLCGGAVAYTGETRVYCPHCTNTVIAALGTPLVPGASAAPVPLAAGYPAADEAWLREVLSIAQSGQKIEAIKIFREHHNCGLKEAKESVEALLAGQPLAILKPAQTVDYQSELERLMKAGRKIEAIALFRQHHNCGLKEAKDSVEALMAGQSLTASPPASHTSPATSMAEVERLMKAGRKIEAIKVYREMTGSGLAEAKNAVEQMVLR